MGRIQAHYINRELSWLEFNQRVLEEAEDESVPLLERLKFLAITDSNLQEFFMVRVGGLRMLARGNVTTRDPSGLTPTQQLALINQRTQRMVQELYDTYRLHLEPGLADAGFHRTCAQDLTESQRDYLSQLFNQEIGTVITPMAVSARPRFPLLRNLGLHLAVRLRPRARTRKQRFAVIPMGVSLDRFITLPSGTRGYRFVLLEDVARLFVGRLFPGEVVAECVAFRITRNADLSVEEDAADLLLQMQEVLAARKRGDCVRLEIQEPVTDTLLKFLKSALSLDDSAIYRVPGPVGLSAFMRLASMEGFDRLRYDRWPPQPHPNVDPARSIFAVLAQHDVLLSHPYDSFEPVLRLLQEAADDPDVLAIKQILYRTSSDSPVIAALARAARNGKYVTVIVELKARFDEAQNIEWARKLEQDGVQVIYGVKGLKTHAKACIVVRRETGGIVRYLHFGTGNYNENTARLYTDISLMTCDEALGSDASGFFNTITGYSAPQQFLKLEAAPLGLRKKVVELIDAEAERSAQDQPALIMAKMNSLVDAAIIEALYRASRRGVRILLNVRGICCLRPGMKGLSETITVVSIVDRFLEHSRVFYFRHGGEGKMYISSADWMPRNLDRRAELLVPIDDVAHRTTLISLLETTFADTVKGRRLLANGSYERLRSADGEQPVRSQQAFYQQAREAVAQAQQASRTVFTPHRPPKAEH